MDLRILDWEERNQILDWADFIKVASLTRIWSPRVRWDWCWSVTDWTPDSAAEAKGKLAEVPCNNGEQRSHTSVRKIKGGQIGAAPPPPRLTPCGLSPFTCLRLVVKVSAASLKRDEGNISSPPPTPGAAETA